MSQAATRTDAAVVPLHGPVAGELAQVVDGLPDAPVVAFGASRQPARIALSCLLCPEPGDTVLVARTAGTCWVLAVLQRPGSAPLRLRTAGDLEIGVGGRLTLAGSEMAVRARSARMLIEEVHHAGERLTAHVSRLKLVGLTFETLTERLLTRVRRSYRFVEETDQVRSAEIDHRASETLRLSGRNAFMLADGVVKVDGEQIHMG